jgi:hypothetical protein
MYLTFDMGEKANDRYTVFPFRRSRDYNTRLMYLGFNDCPTSPNAGVSMWGEARLNPLLVGQGFGKRIPFKSLPEALQRHVIARVKG